MRLHVITPIVNCASRTREEFGAVLDASVQLSAEVLPQGPASIEDEVSEAQAVPHVDGILANEAAVLVVNRTRGRVEIVGLIIEVVEGAAAIVGDHEAAVRKRRDRRVELGVRR